MKNILIFLLSCCALIASSQPITGSFGSPGTATQIKGVFVPDKGMNVPTDAVPFNPTRPWAIRATIADSTLELWTGFTWVKVRGLFTETDPLFNTKFAAKTTTDLIEGSNLYWTSTRSDNRYLKLSSIPDSIARYGFYFESPLGVVAGVGVNPSTGLPNRDTVVVVPGTLTNTYLANMAAATFKGSIAGGVPADLTVSQARSLLSITNVENTALSTWPGTTNLNTLGTIITGVWNGSIIPGQYGGTGVNNSGKSIQVGGNFTTTGAFPLTFTLSSSTSLTLPTTGTVSTIAGNETLTNKTLTSPLINSPRLNSSSIVGYIWTATDVLGNGGWALATAGDVTAAGNNIFTGTNSFTNVSFKLAVPHTNDILKTKILVEDTVTGNVYHQPGSYITETGGSAGLPVVYLSAGQYGIASASAMRTTLALVVGTNVQAFDADLSTLAGLTATTDNFIVGVSSAWASRTPAQVRTTLALVVGTNVQAFDADLTTYAGITPSANVQSFLGAANYAAMRTLLGLVVGTDVQAYDADLTTYAGITPSANVQSLLGAADYAAMRTLLGLVIGTNVQAFDADLSSIAALTGTDILIYRSAANTYSAVSLGANMTFSGGVLNSIGGGGGVTDHGALTGLSDDDHSIYALLAGRSGGQTLTGGTAAGDDLTLSSTSNGTKGEIYFGSGAMFDELNGSFKIGTTSGSLTHRLNVEASAAAEVSQAVFRNGNASANSGSGLGFIVAGNTSAITGRVGHNYDGSSYVTFLENTVGGALRKVFKSTNTENVLNDDGINIDTRIAGDNDANLFFVDASTDMVGIGTNTPTAFLHTKASTTTGASIRIPSGTAPTSPNHGDVWTDGSHMYIRLSGVTYQLDQQSVGGGGVSSVGGTSNRITSSGGSTPAIDIAATYTGQTSITDLGVITTGTWNAGAVTSSLGVAATASLSQTGVGGTNAEGLYLRKQTQAAASPLTNQGLFFVDNSGIPYYAIGNPTVSKKLILDGDYTFSTGINNSSNVLTAKLATGFAGGQSVIGGTAASENLTVSSTTNGTKGSVIFGTTAGMVWDEANTELRLGSASDLGAYIFQATGAARITGALTLGANLISSGIVYGQNGIGYPTGVATGGSITQATSKSTGVTLNKATGEIVMNAAALAAATIATFTLTNSLIEAGDIIVVNHVTTGTRGGYTINANAAAGSATITVRNNTAGSLSEAIVIRFSIIKSAAN